MFCQAILTIPSYRGNEQQRNQLYEIIKSEGLMTDTALNRDPEECVLKACTIDEIEEYIVDATGASVTADSSVRLIHKYCDTLPRNEYVSSSVIFLEFTAQFSFITHCILFDYWVKVLYSKARFSIFISRRLL